MNAVILTVGDEILIGQITNTNAAWLGERLGLAGVTVARMETVGDDEPAIRRALGRALEEAELVVVTGGLGPTHDDVTVSAVAEGFGRAVAFRPELMEEVEAKFAARGLVPLAAHRAFAEVPEGFEVLPNPKGMAPGLWGARDDGRLVAVLPGVPYEMKAIVEDHVLPRLRDRVDGGVVLHKTLLTVGEGETALAERLGALSDGLGEGVTLAFLPGLGMVRLRLTVRGSDRVAAQAQLDAGADRLRHALGDLVFGEDDETLEGVVGEGLAARGLTLAVAESCTGGAVAARLTSAPGASRYFVGGIVAYDNAVKRDALGVEAATLQAHGAVSEPVARQLAAGARAALGTDLAVATTGVAGPTGGTPEKPVGTVWLGYADAAGTHAVRLRFTPDRAVNIALSTTAALNLLRRQLLRRDRQG
ncbi:MAG: competence/damage-inducible protein A [Rubricoccaceae bacterium]|nr:competence/damage-inducible protein A [Rubricoccaceae bacterium]